MDTDTTMFDWVIRRLDKVTGPNAEGWYHARCPACGGKQPLGIRPYLTTSFLHKCFKSDCTADEILAALNGEAPKRDAVRAVATTGNNRDLGERALEIWEAADPAPSTLVEQYLRSRGITLKPPSSLRFHPSVYHKETGLKPAAMIALVHNAMGEPTAILRTWLRRPIFGATVGKANIEPNKMLLGPCTGGAVRLGPAKSTLALAEGVETALSVTQLTGLVCWAGVSGNLTGVVVPKQVHEIVLAVDGDQQGDKYLAELARRFKREGFKVRAMQAPREKDWNDVLRGKS